MNISGVIPQHEIEAVVAQDEALYELAPAAPARQDPNIIASLQSLANFETTARTRLADIEREHGRLEAVDLFGAIPLTPAITLGRILMPNVSPAWTVFERDEASNWNMVMEIQRRSFLIDRLPECWSTQSVRIFVPDERLGGHQ